MVEGASTGVAPATGVSDGAGFVFCPKVVGAVAAGGGKAFAEEGEAGAFPDVDKGGVAVPLLEAGVAAGAGVGETSAETSVAAALDPGDAPSEAVGAGPAAAIPPDPGGGVAPPPCLGGDDGGKAAWRWALGWVLPGSTINDAATAPAAATAAAPTTDRRR